MFLADLSLRRPVLATVTILALVALGITSYFGLGINEWPEVEFPYVAVTIVEPGATPEQVENNIAREVEDAIGQVSGVKHVNSHIQEGVALVFAEFTLETVPATAAQDVRDKLGTIRGKLPTDAQEPVISRFDPSAEPVMSLAVSGSMPLTEITTLVNDDIRKKIESINGVGVVNVLGEQLKEVQIQLDQNKMAAYNLTTLEVMNSLGYENLEAPAGNVTTNDRKISLRTSGKIQKMADFNNIPIAKRGGIQLYIRDIAKVMSGVKDPESISFFQGKPTIGVDIIKQSGSNTVIVADDVRKIVEGLKQTLPEGVSLDIVKDNSVNIRGSVNDVIKTIAEGGILAILTVLLFMGNWRTTIISAIAIPTSIISTFFAMKVLGYTLNMMSLMALSLSVGLLIDDAIVVIENIERHLGMGKSPLVAAKDATSEIGLAVMATTFTLVAVFLPLGMMSGITGKFFKQFGITVVVAVLVSLLVSFTLVPLFSSRYLKQQEEHKARGPLGKFLDWFNRQFEIGQDLYARLLGIVLKNRTKSALIVTLLFFGSLGLIPFLGVSFMPTADTGEFSVVATLDSGLTEPAAAQATKQIEDIIRTYPEVLETYSTIKNDQLNIYVQLKNKAVRKRSSFQIISDLRPKLNALSGIQVALNLKGLMQMGKDVQYSLQGDDLDVLETYAEKAQKILETMPGVTDVSSSYKPGKPEENIKIRSAAAADLGVSTGLVASTLHTLYSGTVINQYREGDHNYDVRLMLDPAQRKTLTGLDKIYVPGGNSTPEGQAMISLDQVTDKVFAPAPSEISRSDRKREIQLSANLANLSLGKFEEKFNPVIQELGLPPGYKFVAGGQSSFMGESFTSMGIALVMGVLFIFFILAAQFESYIDPFSIMFSLPLAIIGAIMALFLANDDFGMMANIGVIMLMGLVTKNAILLIDFAKQQRAQGVERDEALVIAGRTRLRPIIMTSVAMIFGMMPLALGLGQGSESRAPMAHAIIGGVITSTLLTLVVVPLMYSFFDDLRKKFRPSTLMTGKKDLAL
ncbi:efflux RND transporter permease subunit [Desulfosporosinus sp. Sb-LF]|uniref:efflux RND transporter permease subunit n=1 Tax=Desulfosporosinus sp. Sb-LF TaxID=2560027 RepID=UPI00107FCF0E|nr:efflux RND transporter permease subunit [Desulfosporosinus sp. Sb-LF]TGE32973.1 efflux RND transporter permease subunit [Desulfosporosinus sp. Sb-LF]